MVPHAEPTTYIVVFDVNIYLDVARHLGEPFSQRSFNDEVIAIRGRHETERVRRHWSLLALALTTSGSFAGNHSLEVWSSPHIDKLVEYKVSQEVRPEAAPEDSGLGWSAKNASNLVDELVTHHVDCSGGGRVDSLIPRGSPPLSHEDGLVYATARDAADCDPLVERFVVTGDRDFLREQELAYPRVLHPMQFVKLVYGARASIAMKSMKPGP